MEPNDISDPLAYPFHRFSGEDLGILQNSEIFSRNSALFMEDDDTSNSIEPMIDEDDDIIILHIDIREPIRNLRILLENKLGVNLNRYEFWLQDAQLLEPHKNLVDQCVKGEGLVQINAQVRIETQRINIVDVLKPTDEALAQLSAERNKSNEIDKPSIAPDVDQQHQEMLSESTTTSKDSINDNNEQSSASVDDISILTNIPDNEMDDTLLPAQNDTEMPSIKAEQPQQQSQPIQQQVDRKPVVDEPATKWIIDNNFRRDLARLRISEDPKEWTIAQVRHWLQWAVRQFNLTQIKLQDWNITGKELTNLTIQEFQQKVPHDPEDLFWTHFELLRKCRMVAVRGQPSDDEEMDEYTQALSKKTPRTIVTKQVKPTKPSNMTLLFNGTALESVAQANRSGNNGQIQLWQFLLEILTDRDHRNIIQWIGGDGEFKLCDPERVAQLWGARKNKPTMNYEKLSRALRYYYDGDMISKVHNKRFVYKFVCDLTQLIGYNAQELANLVNTADPDLSDMLLSRI